MYVYKQKAITLSVTDDLVKNYFSARDDFLPVASVV